MFVLLMLFHHALGQDSPKENKYIIRDIISCPDEGYYFHKELQDLEVSHDSAGACQLCFCEDSSRAVCWDYQHSSCNDTKHHHVGRRALRQFRNPKTFLYDTQDSPLSKNTLEQENCFTPGKTFNLNCPPENWCTGCTVCNCLDNGKWKCQEFNACDNGRLNRKIMKRNIYHLLTDTIEKNNSSTKSIYYKPKKNRMIQYQIEKDELIPDKVYTKNKDNIFTQHTKEILEQRQISAKIKKDRKAIERKAETSTNDVTIDDNLNEYGRAKASQLSAIESYKFHKVNKSIASHNNNTSRKDKQKKPTKMIFMNTKQNKKMSKQQSKMANKPLQETHKLSVRHISIHSDKHKAKITKRHDSKTYLKNKSDKTNKVKQEKLFFKLAYCSDSKGRLARRKRKAEVIGDDIVTLSNETDSELFIAVPDVSPNKSVKSRSEKDTAHYFAYKLVDLKKDAKQPRAAKDFYFPFIDRIDNDFDKLNNINLLSLMEQQEKSTSDTGDLIDQFEQLHGIEDTNSVTHLNRTKLNYSMKKKLSGKDVVRKLKVKSGYYKTIKQRQNFSQSDEIEVRRYIVKILKLLNDPGSGHSMLLNHKRLNALKFIRELLKDMFNKKQQNQTQPIYQNEVLNILCNNFGPCLIQKENAKTINSNAKVLHMEVIKMLRAVKIVKNLLNLLEKPNECIGKPEFHCDILTLTDVMKQEYDAKIYTRDQRILVNSVRQNTRSFIRSVEHFVVIFNNLLSIVTRNGSILEADTMPESKDKNSSQQLMKKLKRLISLYRLSENHFLKSLVSAIPIQKKNSIDNNNVKKDASSAYTMNIMTKLKKLKTMAEAVITKNKQRTRRSLDYDADVVEYLLNVMEYIVKQSVPRNQGMV